MLFMVIEKTPGDSVEAVGKRFREKGRMLPAGVRYEASWLNDDGSICYQIMDSSSREELDQWISCWNDLVDFEVIPVSTSAEFWAKRGQGG
jgi:hypothetical protein